MGKRLVLRRKSGDRRPETEDEIGSSISASFFGLGLCSCAVLMRFVSSQQVG